MVKHAVPDLDVTQILPIGDDLGLKAVPHQHGDHARPTFARVLDVRSAAARGARILEIFHEHASKWTQSAKDRPADAPTLLG